MAREKREHRRSRGKCDLLPHHADLLRERGAAPGQRQHHDHGRRDVPVPAPRRRPRVVPHRHRRARREDRPGRGASGHHPAGDDRPDVGALPRGVAAPGHHQRRLHPHDRAAPQGGGAADPHRPARPGRDLLRRVRRPLLLRLRALLHGQGDRRRQVPRPPDGAHLHQGEELLLPDVGVPGAPDPPPRGAPGLHPARPLPQRGAGLPARAPPGPVDQPAALARAVGHPAAVRRGLRHLRLVRRAAELRLRPRLSRRRALPGVLARGHPPDRQGHPQAPRRVLAGDALGGQPAALPGPARARVLVGGRAEDVQVARQRGRAPTRWPTSTGGRRSATSCSAR